MDARTTSPGREWECTWTWSHAVGLRDVDHVTYHAERPGFRITEIRMSPTQHVPWHRHTDVEDTFFVLQGRARVTLRDPDQ